MTGDIINGTFEACGSLAVAMSIRAVLKDKCWSGLSVWNLLFFNAWGVWNTIYYPSIGQYWSFIGGCILVSSNSVYLFCIWWFPHQITTPQKVIQNEP